MLARTAIIEQSPFVIHYLASGHWPDASDTGTIDVKDLPPGQHKMTIDLVDGNHELFPRTVQNGHVHRA